MDNKEARETESKTKLLTALGFFTLSWSALVRSVEVLVWEFLDLDTDRGRMVTSGLGGKALIDLLKSLSHLGPSTPASRKEIDGFLEKLSKFNLDRVDFAHAYWSFAKRKKDGAWVLRSERYIAKGKLKPKSEVWTHEKLVGFVKDLVETNETVTNMVVAIRAFKAKAREKNAR